jgi:hypothetical protein
MEDLRTSEAKLCLDKNCVNEASISFQVERSQWREIPKDVSRCEETQTLSKKL